jgi:hypothetical protein
MQLDVQHLRSRANLIRGMGGGLVNNALHIARDCSGEVRWADRVQPWGVLLHGPLHGRLSVRKKDRSAKLRSLQVRLFVCNNDESVKVRSLQDGRHVTTIACTAAVNYCALSPDRCVCVQTWGGWVGGARFTCSCSTVVWEDLEEED